MTPADSLASWRPSKIALLDRVSGCPRATRIVECFPGARVRIVNAQRGRVFEDSILQGELVVSKSRLLIGETRQCLRFPDGEIGEDLVCFPYRKLAPLSNGCVYQCAYCRLIMNYWKRQPYIKANVNWERMFDELDRDLFAAGQTAQAGYPVRFRIDPGILIPNWRAAYTEMINGMFDHVATPENITLGMLRLVPRHYVVAERECRVDLREAGRLTEKCNDGKLRYASAERIAFCQFLIERIKTRRASTPISICRESADVYRTLRSQLSPVCNCRPSSCE
ncbi:MAG TPA: hypothetical protein VM492_05100 [Sumerlaeia bacterium]|nr:hypothetical protein [Sumerlaeia bacterium]